MPGKGNAKHSSLERTGNNKILAEELHKPVIKFRDNKCGVDLADTQSLSKKIKVLNIFYVL